MQTDKVNLKEEVVLNPSDILWKLLMQWRMILVFALLGAILVSGLSYMKSVSNYKKALQNYSTKEEVKTSYTAEEIAKLQNKLKGKSLVNARKAVFDQRKILADQKYLDTSLLMKIDPYYKKTATVEYYLNGNEPKEAETLCRAFSGKMCDESVLKELAQDMNQKVDSKDLSMVMRELVKVDYTGSANTVGTAISSEVNPVITVSVILPKGSDTDRVIETVKNEMKAISGDLNRTVAKHKLNLLESYVKITSDSSLGSKQDKLRKEITSSLDDARKATKSFSDKQKKFYNAELTNIRAELGIEEKSTSKPKAAPAKPSISKKAFAVGFLVFVLLYAVAYIILTAHKRRVNGGDDIAKITGLRKYGEYHNYAKTGFERFVWSRGVFKSHYSRYLDKDEMSEFASEGIGSAFSILRNEEKLPDNVTILSLDTLTPINKAFSEAVVNGLKNSAIKASQKQYSVKQLLTDADAVSSMGTIVLAVTQGETKYSELGEFFRMTSEYKIPVMGYLYVD